MKKLVISGLVSIGLGAGLGVSSAWAAGEGVEVPSHDWAWDGIFGAFDEAQLQRGFQVYQQVCALCHAMDLVAFRHLEGIGFSEEDIEAISAEYTMGDINFETGQPIERPGRPADHLPSPFPNETVGRYTYGVYPPDLSVIAKAREGGADYLFALLTGYTAAPADVELTPRQQYNLYFPGHVIAMPKPLFDGQVEYIDGTPNTEIQMAEDVTAFLTWAAEPSLVERKELGVKVILFLIVLSGLMYAVKRKIWSDVEH